VLPFSTYAQNKLCTQWTSRAISIDESVFEVKMNILGKFYLSPKIIDFRILGDTISLNGTVSHLYNPKSGVEIFLCTKEELTFREKIARIELYKIVRYGGASDLAGKFDLSFNYRNEVLLFRDYTSGLDSFWFLEVKSQCD
jgi:hypothetical protein